MTANDFHLDFNVTGTERKKLVQAVSACTGADAKYLGAPSFAYSVDCFTIDRNGAVSFDARTDGGKVEGLIAALADEGFVPQDSANGETRAAETGCAAPESETAACPAESETSQQSGNTALTVRIPLDMAAVGNLKRLLEAKGSLIKTALGVAELPVRIEESAIAFPWFTNTPNADEVKAYTHLINALCELSRNQKRITAKEKEVDNEKYAFRCFLLRLGFIGTEYKTERKILLRNLSGSPAFKISKTSKETGRAD